MQGYKHKERHEGARVISFHCVYFIALVMETTDVAVLSSASWCLKLSIYDVILNFYA